MNDTPPTKQSDTKKQLKFFTIYMSKLGSLIPDNTEVVDVNDVFVYKTQYNASNRSNLIPYIIYMDSEFNQVIKSKKKKDALILLVKIFGVVICFTMLVVVYKIISKH